MFYQLLIESGYIFLVEHCSLDFKLEFQTRCKENLKIQQIYEYEEFLAQPT